MCKHAAPATEENEFEDHAVLHVDPESSCVLPPSCSDLTLCQEEDGQTYYQPAVDNRPPLTAASR
eukprot:5027704-Pyramimonas_sp.AAC.1